MLALASGATASHIRLCFGLFVPLFIQDLLENERAPLWMEKACYANLCFFLFVFLRGFLRSESARSRRCAFRKAGRHAEATAAPLAWKQLKQQRDKIYIYIALNILLLSEKTQRARGAWRQMDGEEEEADSCKLDSLPVVETWCQQQFYPSPQKKRPGSDR